MGTRACFHRWWTHVCNSCSYRLSILFGGGNGTPLQYSCLENSMDGGAWWAIVHGVVKSRTWLSDFTFSFSLSLLGTAASYVLFCNLVHLCNTIDGTCSWETGGTTWGLQSTGSRRVGHDWATSLLLFTFLHWRRKWQPTPVFLPGESQGRGAWWAAVYGVTQSRTRLKRLSSSRWCLHGIFPC